MTEEQIIHTFNSVGQVNSFRLVYDQDTGRPKGFGFAEFADTDSAASAVRNLNGYEIMGRELRVDFSHVGGKDDSQPNANLQSIPQPQQGPPNGFQSLPPGSILPPLPPGVDLPPQISCPDAISKTLSTLTPPQLLDILSQMKGLVMGDPARATELLSKAPQLSYAIFQALLLMGLVDTSVLASVVEGNGAPPQAIPRPVPPQPAPVYPPYPAPQQQPQYPGMPGQMHAPTPPVHNQYQPPPMQQPPPQQQQQNTSQAELIKTVMAMTQQQIDSLPPNERQQIIALRQSLGARY